MTFLKFLLRTRSMQSFITNGVLSVEKPLNPKDLASMRAERIAKEKARALAVRCFFFIQFI